MKFCFENPQGIAKWVARKIPEADDFGPCTAMGIVHEGKPIAGFVYSMYDQRHGTMQISMAAESPRWATKGNIRAALSYPFEQLGIRKLWCIAASDNERSLKLIKGVGFTQEAQMAHQFGYKRHAIILRMFDHEFRRRYGETHEMAA